MDHRGDWTYSLIVPRGFEVAELRGGESYREIHEALVGVLENVKLAEGGGGGGVCFENAVEFDVVDGAGAKVAGAGQRRTRWGLLHQGSVAMGGGGRLRGELFAKRLSEGVFEVELEVDEGRVEELVRERYGSEEWLGRR